ncbi:inositol 1,4,5-trisphosphate receptor-interacting protein-like 1 [Columba livia]|uniref:Inositol 1,4,5-trisphosphate receptor-interacting protein-like 1 n=1 Tax=Columba livia TaxID=8932 RepID=A0A2I0MQ02_COLLI|nr:inositol 1,4,5-trisphosphate receptor-interacting protein-like 1 [Columba livia]PKK31758.1 inositol 1,4,5-trisphosphate receptor-interacting protein-like 1 [Columba livia]
MARFALELVARILRYLIMNTQVVNEELDKETRERMQQREEMLNREMARLWQEIEQRDQELRDQELRKQEKSVSAWASLFLAALQHWQFWAVAGGLVLLFGLCWWLRKRSHQTASKQTASSSEDNSRLDTDKKEQEEKLSIALNVGTISAQRLLDVPESLTTVVELVDELLRRCRNLSRNAFVPQPKPAIAVGNDIDGMSHCEDHAVYHLLVPLKPPRGHSFHLEMDTVEAMPARKSRLRVELECTCRREDMLCFLHCCKEELRQNQSASLLDTLCTGHRLDMEKTTRWFQILVKAAWVVLPQSTRQCLTVLPSRRSCKLRLTDRSSNTLLIEVMFGVQQDGSDTVLSIE